MKLSQIIPKAIKTTIPVCHINEDGETVVDSIKIYTPTTESVEEFHSECDTTDTDIGTLMLLIKYFTDIDNDIDESQLESFSIYFDDTWNILQDELFSILGTIIKDGESSKKKLKILDDSIIDNIRDEYDPKLADELTYAKKNIILDEKLNELRKEKEKLSKVGV